jgi:solute carrier family 25, member 44
MAVQGASTALAGGTAALVTMPLDTVKTRLQVMEADAATQPTLASTVRGLLKEGGWAAC